jgi:hypothetical protein
MSEPVFIPTSSDVPLYTQRLTLDGQEFLFRFDWNERTGRWYFGIYSIDELPLVTGVKLVADWPLLHRCSNPDLPKGDLLAVDFSPLAGEPPGFVDLGNRVRLVYFPKGSLT